MFAFSQLLIFIKYIYILLGCFLKCACDPIGSEITKLCNIINAQCLCKVNIYYPYYK